MSSPGSGRAALAQDLDGARDALVQASQAVERIQSHFATERSGLPPLAPVRVVAQWIGMTERGVRKLIEHGAIPASKVGKWYVVRVHDWMAKLRAEAVS